VYRIFVHAYLIDRSGVLGEKGIHVITRDDTVYATPIAGFDVTSIDDPLIEERRTELLELCNEVLK